MTQQQIQGLLEAVQQGKLQPREAVERLKHLPFEDLGFAKIDHHRLLRQGMPETVYAPGKTPEQVARIVRQMLKHSPNVLVTRANRSVAARFIRSSRFSRFTCFYPLSGAIAIRRDRTQYGKGTVI